MSTTLVPSFLAPSSASLARVPIWTPESAAEFARRGYHVDGPIPHSAELVQGGFGPGYWPQRDSVGQGWKVPGGGIKGSGWMSLAGPSSGVRANDGRTRILHCKLVWALVFGLVTDGRPGSDAGREWLE
jgi:hypothetical protein